VQNFLHLHQLLAQLLPRRRSRRACVRACVNVVRWVENCTRQVLYMPVQTSIYTGTYVIDTAVYTCDHTHHRVYIHAIVYAHFVYFYCPISLLHACVSQVLFNTCMREWKGVACVFQLVHG